MEANELKNYPTSKEFQEGYLLGAKDGRYLAACIMEGKRNDPEATVISVKILNYSLPTIKDRTQHDYATGYLTGSTLGVQCEVETRKAKDLARYPRSIEYQIGWKAGWKESDAITKMQLTEENVDELEEKYVDISSTIARMIQETPQSDYAEGFLTGFEIRSQKDINENPEKYHQRERTPEELLWSQSISLN